MFKALPVLVWGSSAAKRHHDHGKSYKRKHLIVVAASSFRGLVYYHRGRTWQHAGRHGAGEGAGSSIS